MYKFIVLAVVVAVVINMDTVGGKFYFFRIILRNHLKENKLLN